jgi:hypothetical protein
MQRSIRQSRSAAVLCCQCVRRLYHSISQCAAVCYRAVWQHPACLQADSMIYISMHAQQGQCFSRKNLLHAGRSTLLDMSPVVDVSTASVALCLQCLLSATHYDDMGPRSQRAYSSTAPPCMYCSPGWSITLSAGTLKAFFACETRLSCAGFCVCTACSWSELSHTVHEALA